MRFQKLVRDIIAQKQQQGITIDSIFFVGCGGSFAVHYPGQYFLAHESKNLKVGMYNSNEFVHAMPKSCNERSVVIACSMRGTAETAEAVKAAKAAGATTVSFYVEESEMTKASDYIIPYISVAKENEPITDTNDVLVLELAVELLEQLEGYDNYPAFCKAIDKLDEIFEQAKVAMRPEAVRLAQECCNDDLIYVMGAGPSTGAAYIFSICNLMEMQWVHSPTVNFAELVHGPFETVDEKLPIVCLLSTGPTRPVDMRAMKFLRTYGKRLYVLDAQQTGLADLDPAVSQYFCQLVLTPMLQQVFLQELAEKKNHPATTRRYMWKVEY